VARPGGDRKKEPLKKAGGGVLYLMKRKIEGIIRTGAANNVPTGKSSEEGKKSLAWAARTKMSHIT